MKIKNTVLLSKYIIVCQIEMEQAPCPLCKQIVNFWERYPLAICGTCASDVKDPSGNPVRFKNVDWTGGFISIHTIDGAEVRKEEHICYVKGVKCYADETRFGGIIIEVCQ
jgi:hypothetical protein